MLPSRSAFVKPDLEAVPVDLRDRPRWLVWRFGPPRSNGKRPKRPVDQETLKPVDATCPSNWMPFSTACQALGTGRFDGLGFALAGDGLVGLDLDQVVEPATGALTAAAEQVVHALESYSELSPSGTGVRIFAMGEIPEAGRRRDWLEVYCRDRYLTVTGARLPGSPLTVEPRHQELADLFARHFGDDRPQIAPAASERTIAPPVDLDDVELLARASRARNGDRFSRLWAGDWSGYTSQSEADQALLNILAFWCGPNPDRLAALFRASVLGARPKAFRQDYLPRSIRAALGRVRTYYVPPPPREERKPPTCELKSVPCWTAQVANERGLERLLVVARSLSRQKEGGRFGLSVREAGSFLGLSKTQASRVLNDALARGLLVRVAGSPARHKARLADEYVLGDSDVPKCPTSGTTGESTK